MTILTISQFMVEYIHLYIGVDENLPYEQKEKEVLKFAQTNGLTISQLFNDCETCERQSKISPVFGS